MFRWLFKRVGTVSDVASQFVLMLEQLEAIAEREAENIAVAEAKLAAAREEKDAALAFRNGLRKVLEGS